MGAAESTGYARVADVLGMLAPRPRLRVVRDEEGQERGAGEGHGVWRPANLDDYVGQVRAQLKVKMHVTAALKRGAQPGHVLLSGPPGLGKTTLAAIVAALINEGRPKERHVALHTTMGTSVASPKQLAKQLAKLCDGDVLLIDECHQIGLKAEEMLGLAMEDGRISVAGTESGSTDGVEVELSPFTLVCATTKPANLSRPLRDRFGLSVALEYYADDELAEIVRRAAEREQRAISDEAALAIAKVGRNTPRVALQRLGMVTAFADTVGAQKLDLDTVHGAMDVMGIDSEGLDERDRDYCDVLASWAGRRVGLLPLAAKSGLDDKEIRDDIEPYLLRAAFIDQTSRGRCLTRHAYRHLYPNRPIPPMLGLS